MPTCDPVDLVGFCGMARTSDGTQSLTKQGGSTVGYAEQSGEGVVDGRLYVVVDIIIFVVKKKKRMQHRQQVSK